MAKKGGKRQEERDVAYDGHSAHHSGKTNRHHRHHRQLWRRLLAQMKTRRLERLL